MMKGYPLQVYGVVGDFGWVACGYRWCFSLPPTTMTVKKRPSGKRKKRTKPTGPSKGRQLTHRRAPKRAEESTQPGSNTTPQVAPYISTFLYTSAISTLTQRRKDVMYDVGAIDEIPFLKLLEAVLPIDDPQNTTKVWKMVKSRANIVTGDSWTDFQQLPSEQSGTEENVFKPLKDIFQAITGAAGKVYLQEVQFGVHGSKTPASTGRIGHALMGRFISRRHPCHMTVKMELSTMQISAVIWSSKSITTQASAKT